MKNALKLFFASLLFSSTFVSAQTYSSACGLNISIPDNSCTGTPLFYSIPVGGVAGTQLGVDVVLAEVHIIVSHAFASDVEMYLQSPIGPAVALSIANGLGGSNYGNPADVTCTAATNFNRDAVVSITAGAAPFIGTFRPQEDFSNFDDGSNPNGTWMLIICDNLLADSGALQYVSLTFASPCEQPLIDVVLAGSDEAEVQWQSSNSGATYTIEWGVPGFTPGGIGSLGSVSGISASGFNSRSIAGLTALSEYELYVSEDCGLLQSPAEGPYYFITTKVNDLCSSAIPVTCGTLIIDSTLAGATAADAPGFCITNHDESPGLWYVFAGNGADVTVSLCGASSNFDTKLGIFEGPCQDLTCVNGSDDFCGFQSEVTFTAEIGKDYYIYVSGFGGEVGIFEMSISCNAALVINEVDYAQPGVDTSEFIELYNAGGAAINLDDFALLLIDGTGGGSALYNFIDLPLATLAAGGYFVICGDSSNISNCDFTINSSEWLNDGNPDAIALILGNTQLDAVSYNGNTGAPYTEISGVGLEDDSTQNGIGISRTPDGFDTDENNIDFISKCISPGIPNILQSANCTVPNDSCSEATVIQPGLGISFDNRGATTDGDTSMLCFNGGSVQIFSDVWFSFTPDCDGIATFSTDSVTAYDTKIAVYLAPCPGTIVDCNDDINGSNFQSEITWTVTGGIEYLLRLGGFDSTDQDVGVFNLLLAETDTPFIVCSPDKSKNTDPGLCTATVNPLPPFAFDNCSPVTVVNDFNNTSSAAGSYPVGITVITWTAADESGNSATCQQTIDVTDSEIPSITCPVDIVQTVDSGLCTAAVTVPPASVSDNCSVASIANGYNGTADASDVYPVGTTSVFWLVEDASGSTNFCFQNITITDNEFPTITCPFDYVIPNCTDFAVIPSPTTGDNCSVASLINDYNGTSDASDFYNVGVTPITWTATDASGNIATCSMNVYRNSPPSAGISPANPEACKAQDMTLFGNPVPGSSPLVSHSWTAGGFSGPVNRDSVIFNVGVTGVFGPVIYKVTDSSGCFASDTVFVTVLNIPVSTIVPDVVELCEGNSIQLNGNPSGGNGALVSHAWIGDTSTLSSTVVVNPDFNGTPAGVYDLTYTVTDSKGCKGSDNLTVIVNTQPSVSITPDPAEVCAGAPLMLDANLLAGTGNILSRGWTGNTSPLSSLVSATPSFNTSTPGNYNLTFSVIDDNLCTASDNITVTVNALPVASFSGLDANYCENDSSDILTGLPAGGSFSGAGLAGQPLVFDYPDAPDTITDLAADTSDFIISTPASVLGGDIFLRQVCFTIEHGYLGDIEVYLQSPDGSTVRLGSALCGNLDDMDVCIEAGTANSIDNAICSFSPPAVSGLFNASLGFDLDDLNNGGSPNGTWKLYIPDSQPGEDGLLLSWALAFEYMGVNTFVPAFAGPGVHTITYTYTDGNGCFDSTSQTTTVNALPNAFAGADVSICEGGDATLTATGGTSYEWNTGDQTPSITVNPLNTTSYSVTVTDAAGCDEQDDVTVTVNPLPFIAFTGLDTQYCLNADPDTLNGFPPDGIFSGPGVSTIGAGSDTVSFGGAPVVVPDTLTTSVFNVVSGVFGNALGTDSRLDRVCINIQHGYVGDLYISLTSPGGVTVTLATAPCGDFNNIEACIEPGTGTSMDNAACSFVPPALSGTFTASSAVNDNLDFINDGVTNPNGVWQLDVYDAAVGDTGLVVEFSLHFSSLGITTFSPAAAGEGTHNVIYTYTDNITGCLNSDTTFTEVLALPVASAQSDTGICPGGILTLSATGGTFYSWSTGSVFDTTIVSPFSTTVYSVTVSDSIGCSAQDDVTVTVFTAPVADAGLDIEICLGSSTTLTATGGVSYVWSTGDSVSTIMVSPAAETTYYVTATDANGCIGSDSVLVEILPLPFAVPGANQDICLGDTVTITASGGATYSWSDGLITSGTGARPASPASTTVYFVIVADSSGCTDTTSLTVNVHAIPVASIAGLDALYCNNNNPDTLVGIPAGGSFAGPAVNGDVFSPALLPPDTFTIIYTYIDSFGCTDNESRNVIIYDAPPVTFSGLMPQYCVDTSAHLMTGSPSGGTFSGAGVSGNTFVSFYAGPGTHDIIYVHSGGGFCPGRDTQSVIVHALPLVSISGLDAFYCTGGIPDTLSGVPAGGIFSGNDMFGDVFFPPQTVNTLPSVVSYEYFDANGCGGKVNAVAEVQPTPTPVIINPGNLCTNEGAVALSGSPSGGTFSGPGVSGNSIQTAVAGAGIHPVLYTLTNAGGCMGDTTVFITVNDTPAVALLGLDTSYCNNSAVVFMNGTPAGGIYRGAGVIGYTFDASLAGVGGPYPVTYTYTDTNGCSSTAQQNVTVLNFPFLVISGLNNAYCIYDAPVTVNVAPTGGTLAGGGISNDMFSPQLAGIGTHIITYRYTTANGCLDLAKTFVTVDACVGINEPALDASVLVYPNPTEGRFIVEVKALTDENGSLKIYDVAGKQIYEETLPKRANTFSAEINLTGFPKGVYYLKMNLKDGVVMKKVVVQ